MSAKREVVKTTPSQRKEEGIESDPAVAKKNSKIKLHFRSLTHGKEYQNKFKFACISVGIYLGGIPLEKEEQFSSFQEWKSDKIDFSVDLFEPNLRVTSLPREGRVHVKIYGTNNPKKGLQEALPVAWINFQLFTETGLLRTDFEVFPWPCNNHIPGKPEDISTQNFHPDNGFTMQLSKHKLRLFTISIQLIFFQ